MTMNAEFARQAISRPRRSSSVQVLLRVSDSRDRDVPRPPVWARWLDLFAVTLLAVACIAAIVGGIRFRIAFIRVSLTSPLRIVAAAVAVAVVRHLLAPRIPIYRDLPIRFREWRRATLVDDVDVRAPTPMPRATCSRPDRHFHRAGADHDVSVGHADERRSFRSR